MPEGLEVEIYRRIAERLVGRRVAGAHVDDRRADPGLVAALRGATFERADRIGKLLLLGTDGPTLGIHFGMTGRIVVDGVAPIAELEYGSGLDDPAWDRLVVDLVDGGCTRVNDQRRWARFSLDPDTSTLGPDVLSVSRGELDLALRGTTRPVKAVLLDQHRLAGLGNMCVDEVLWHAAIAPTRSSDALTDGDVDALHHSMREHLPAMLDRGGSHTGVLTPAVRSLSSVCPVDGGALTRGQVAGRTSVWCSEHQP